MDPVTLTIDEINSILELKNLYESITQNLGRIQLERKSLELREKELYDMYAETTAKEKVLIADIQKKYGDGTIDLNTYHFTPSE